VKMRQCVWLGDYLRDDVHLYEIRIEDNGADMHLFDQLWDEATRDRSILQDCVMA